MVEFLFLIPHVLFLTLCIIFRGTVTDYILVFYDYYTMNFMQGQGLAKSKSHAHV